VRIEVELAKEEVKKEVKQAEGAGIVFGAAAAFASVCLSMLGVAIVIAAGGTAVAALIVSGSCLVIAGVAAGIGYALVPKKPLEHSMERAETDLRQLKEHAV
jgi:ABC-type Fe3+ transport system permease subunit